MRILFINLPYYGHIIPTIGLIQELIKLDNEVTYLLPFCFEDIAIQSNAKFHGYNNHIQLSEQIKNAYNEASKIIDDYDLVIYEQFFFLGKHLADKYHKPVVRIFTAPVTNKKLMDEYIKTKGPLSIFRYKWINRAFTKDIAKDIPLKTDNWLDEIIYNPPGLNLVYTLREYQPYEEDFVDDMYKFLGPSIYDRNDQYINYTKGDKPLIYISLGTVIKANVSFYTKCIKAFGNKDVDVIIATGRGFKLNKLKDIPNNIHIYDYVPQLKVLKMADVFITHGGMNSISEALYNIVPMIIIPFHSDQPSNAKTMEKLGVAKYLEYHKVNKDILYEYAMEVLNNRMYKEKLLNIYDLIKVAPGNRGGALMIKEYYELNK